MRQIKLVTLILLSVFSISCIGRTSNTKTEVQKDSITVSDVNREYAQITPPPYEGVWLKMSILNGDYVIYAHPMANNSYEAEKIIVTKDSFKWTSCFGDDFYSPFPNVEEIENMTYFFDFGAKVRFIDNEKGIGEWTLYTDSDTTKEISITLYVDEEKNTFPIIEWEWDDEF